MTPEGEERRRSVHTRDSPEEWESSREGARLGLSTRRLACGQVEIER